MSTLSFTQLRHCSVHDSQGTVIGQLEDLFVLPLGTRPQVTKFSLRRPDLDDWILPWASVAEVPATTDRPVRLRYPLANLSSVALRAEEVPRMTPEELKEMLGKPGLVIIDVRSNADWMDSAQKIKGAVRQDPKKVSSWMGKYPKDRTLVFYCS